MAENQIRHLKKKNFYYCYVRVSFACVHLIHHKNFSGLPKHRVHSLAFTATITVFSLMQVITKITGNLNLQEGLVKWGLPHASNFIDLEDCSWIF